MLTDIFLWSARIMLLLLAVIGLLPLIPSGLWWIRIWDFPRLQLAALVCVPLVLIAIDAWRAQFKTEHAVLIAIAIAAGTWQLGHIVPFTPLWPKETPDATADNSPVLRLLTANIKYENLRHADMVNMFLEQDADLALVVEVDEKWAEALAPLDEHYPHRVGVVRGEGLGLVLWSRFPLLHEEVRHLVSERRASIFVTVDVPELGPVRYIGVHPTPPGLKERVSEKDQQQERRDSRVRDAELVLVAREVERDPDQRWIVSGDFNDVAWSHTTRLFQDLSGLKDPRVGRALLNTYPAAWPPLRFPIDHVFVSDGLHLASLKRVPAPGSDHFAIACAFTFAAQDRTTPDASAAERQEAEEMVEQGAEDAAEYDEKVPAVGE